MSIEIWVNSSHCSYNPNNAIRYHSMFIIIIYSVVNKYWNFNYSLLFYTYNILSECKQYFVSEMFIIILYVFNIYLGVVYIDLFWTFHSTIVLSPLFYGISMIAWLLSYRYIKQIYHRTKRTILFYHNPWIIFCAWNWFCFPPFNSNMLIRLNNNLNYT